MVKSNTPSKPGIVLKTDTGFSWSTYRHDIEPVIRIRERRANTRSADTSAPSHHRDPVDGTGCGAGDYFGPNIVPWKLSGPLSLYSPFTNCRRWGAYHRINRFLGNELEVILSGRAGCHS